MIIIGLTTRDGYGMVMLDSLRGIEYDEKTGELLFIGTDSVRPVYLDKGTPAVDVWGRVRVALNTIYEARALQTHACYVDLDLTRFQLDQPRL